MSDQPRIFVSYARTDGEVFAKELRRRLIEDHGFSLWQDRSDMEGGKDWWQQIVEALKNVEYLVLVMTPASMSSDIVRKEWRLGRQEGVCVVPVIGEPNLNFANLPNWMRDTHFVSPDVPEQWTRFIRTLESPCQAQRVPFMVEELPDHFVSRKEEYERLIACLFDERREEPVAITATLRGAGGYGKTTLANAVCHDERIQEAFHDGVLWVTLGQQPDVIAGLTKLYAAFTGERPAFVDVEDAANTLAQAWGDRACLVVIDDVWNEAHLRPFLRGGRRCARLITTRDSTTLPANTQSVTVDAMKQAEAVDLLSAGLPDGEEKALRILAARLGEWPFLLKLLNGTLRERVQGQPLDDALTYANKALDKYGLTAFDPRDAVDRKQAVEKTIHASLENLSEDEQERYSELAIFPEDVDIPLSTVAKLWGATGELDDLDTEKLCIRLTQLSLLLSFDLTTQRIRLHDVMRTYLEEKRGKKLTTLHSRFLDAYSPGKWSELPRNESYLWRRLAYHLIQAERTEELRGLLLDFDWMQAKLEATDPTALVADYDILPCDAELAYVRGAIRLSAHVLAEDKRQFASQLLGRMLTGVSPNISRLHEQAEQWRGSPWLRPLAPMLIGPGGALLFTLMGHSARVRSVAVTSDGGHAVSASDDHTLKLWDLKRGRIERTFTGHTDWVRAVVVTSGSRNAISASDDHTLRVWDLELGKEVQRINVCGSWPRALAMSSDGRFAITGSEDRKLRVWNLEQGKEEGVLKGHDAKVNAVVITADGRCAVSASDDCTLRVWNLETGAQVRILRGHTAKINALVLMADERYAISASVDDTIRVWDVERGLEQFTVTRYAYGVRGLGVTPDGCYAISASEDHTLRVWNLEHGVEVRTLQGHTDWVNAVAITPDGQTAISASDDHTLKVWDLSRSESARTFIGHTDRIRAVVLTPDERHAISTSDDHTLRVWDLQERVEARISKGHSHWPVALTPDGRQIVCAAGDGTLQLLDFMTGEPQRTFSGHVDRVRAVTVAPDGHYIISASDDRTIKVWDIQGAEKLTISTQGHWVRALAVTPDGRHLISASDGRDLKVWNLKEGSEERTLSGHLARVNGVAVISDGKHAISASDDYTLKVWDLEEGVEERSLRGHTDRVNSVSVSIDGKRAVSASADFTVKVWNLKTGEAIASFSGDSPMLTCAVGLEAKIIAAGDLSGRLHFLCLETVQ